jgi:hypothetical protein
MVDWMDNSLTIQCSGDSCHILQPAEVMDNTTTPLICLVDGPSFYKNIKEEKTEICLIHPTHHEEKTLVEEEKILIENPTQEIHAHESGSISDDTNMEIMVDPPEYRPGKSNGAPDALSRRDNPFEGGNSSSEAKNTNIVLLEPSVSINLLSGLSLEPQNQGILGRIQSNIDQDYFFGPIIKSLPGEKKKFIPNQIPGRTPPPQPPVIIDGQEEYEVDFIVDSRHYRRQLQYLVHWKGYTSMDRTWETTANLDHSQDLIQEFHAAHPDRPSPLRRAQPRKGAPVRNPNDN